MKLFLVFLNRHQIATTWSSNWPLQHMTIVIRWEDKAFQNSTFFRFFLTIFLKYLYFEWFFWEVTLTIINVFQHARHFVLSSTNVKSQPFWRKSKKLAKNVKIHDFLQKVDFYDFWLLRIFKHPRQCQTKVPKWKGNKNQHKRDFFAKKWKKVIFDPPNLSERSTKSDSSPKVTKGLIIFSPNHGRMQKFNTF